MPKGKKMSQNSMRVASWRRLDRSGGFTVSEAALGGVGGRLGTKNDGMHATEDYSVVDKLVSWLWVPNISYHVSIAGGGCIISL